MLVYLVILYTAEKNTVVIRWYQRTLTFSYVTLIAVQNYFHHSVRTILCISNGIASE